MFLHLSILWLIGFILPLSVISYPGVKPGVDNVSSQIGKEYHHGADKSYRYHNRVVAGKNRIKGYPSQPGYAEDNLGQIGTTKDDTAQVKHDYGNNGQHSLDSSNNNFEKECTKK